MKRKKAVKWILFITFIFILGLAGYSLYKIATVKLPGKEINEARESLARAKNNDASKYASKKLKEAEALYTDAMQEWAIQNERFFWFRDFAKTRDLAAKSLAISSDAKQQSVVEKNNVGKQLNANLIKAEKKIKKFESVYKTLPLERATFDLFNKGKMEYLEAKNELKKNNLVKATLLIERADNNLLKADNSAQKKIEQFFKNYPEWVKNARMAEQLSKKGQTVILVNKIDSKCTVMKSGKTLKVFDAELGSNWMTDKVMKGDRTTPEGVYKITRQRN
jgi:phage anti-repressor protein